MKWNSVLFEKEPVDVKTPRRWNVHPLQYFSMTTHPRALQAKNDGNQAWKLESYELAVQHFTTAIGFGGDDDFRKVVYSNRSAANLKLKRIKESLEDANKCIEIDREWAKGHSRKGNAFMAAKKYSEAYHAYNEGIKVSPNDEALAEKCGQAFKLMKQSAESLQKQQTDAVVPVAGFVFQLKLAVIVFCFAFYLPLGKTITYSAYMTAASLFTLSAIYALWVTYGTPQLNRDYAFKVIPDPSTPRVVLGVALLISRACVLPVTAMLLTELTSVTPHLLVAMNANSELILKMRPLAVRLFPSLSDIDFVKTVALIKPDQLNFHLLRGAASCEVYQGLLLLAELVLPSRNVIQLYMWWQYLLMRFKMDQSGHVKGAFAAVDSACTGVTEHRLCPGVLKTWYGYVRNYLASQADAKKDDK